ncbi:SseB family protein [Buchananella hordeovulneris]|uniref:SseB family protein n=1 Tax=Buchananella hordeovulneris TaxID=52770 RepID=UPI0026DDAE56|nr:SseB family protein [Buchananella hordeovulneris]MDO5080626.1 SseB family protein [Buchananella hordeovulneris]
MFELSAIPLGVAPAPVGPMLSRIDVAEPDPQARPGTISAGTVEVDTDLLFVLSEHPAAANRRRSAADPEVLPVAALPELGSARLAAAIAARSLPDVLEALAEDVAVLPVRLTEEGIEALGVQSDDGLVRLPLFTSAATYAEVATGHEPLFVIRLGVALIEFVVQHAAHLHSLIIDPHRTEAFEVSSRFLAEVLNDPFDEPDELDEPREMTATEPTESASTSPARRVVGLDLDLPTHWAVLNLRAPVEVRQGEIKELVKRQTRKLSDAGANLRREMRQWLERAAAQAAGAGGRDFAFLLANTKEAAAAVSLVTYWHDIGATGSISPLQLMTERLVADSRPGDELVELKDDDDGIVRRVRLSHGAKELGGENTPLVLIDYWLAVPGEGALAHVAFSTPHDFAKDEITRLADAVVLGARWVFADELPPASASFAVEEAD